MNSAPASLFPSFPPLSLNSHFRLSLSLTHSFSEPAAAGEMKSDSRKSPGRLSAQEEQEEGREMAEGRPNTEDKSNKRRSCRHPEDGRYHILPAGSVANCATVQPRLLLVKVARRGWLSQEEWRQIRKMAQLSADVSGCCKWGRGGMEGAAEYSVHLQPKEPLPQFRGLCVTHL